MVLDLTAAGGPIWASRSRINLDSRLYGTFAASSFTQILKRIVDGDPTSYWHEDPETAADDVPVTIDVSAQLRSAKASYGADLVALQNINLKNFKLEYSNDDEETPVNFTIVPGLDYRVGVADNAATDIIVNPTLFEANYYRLTMYRTITPNQAKRVGGIYAAQAVVQLVQGGMDKYEKAFREELRSVKLGDGTRTDERVRRSATSHDHWGATMAFDLVSRAERDLIRGVKQGGKPFTFVPEPNDVPRDIFTALFKGAWKDKYTSTFKGTGYNIDCSMEEVGYL